MGRRWKEVDDLGSILAALGGFTRRGEAGEYACTNDKKSFLTLCSAAGATDMLQVENLPPYLASSLALLAAAGGHSSCLEYLNRKAGNSSFSHNAIVCALKNFHTHLADEMLRIDLRRSASDQATVLSIYANAVTESIGERLSSLRAGSGRLEQRISRLNCGERWYSEEFEDLNLEQTTLREGDSVLVRWSVKRGLPLGTACVKKLVATNNLSAVKCLPHSTLLGALSPDLAVCAVHGGVDVLRYLRSVKPPCPLSAACLVEALDICRDGKMATFLLDEGCPIITDAANLLNSAAKLSVHNACGSWYTLDSEVDMVLDILRRLIEKAYLHGNLPY